MSHLNDEIKVALDAGDVDKARQLLPEALQEANADTFYLASLAAFDDIQRVDFLEKALKINPFHADAYKAKQELDSVGKESKPAEVVKVEPEPKPAPPAPKAEAKPAPKPQVIQPKPTEIVSTQDAINLRRAFTKVGYTHPNTKIAKDVNGALSQVGLKRMDHGSESVILHFGLGKPLTDGIMCKHIEASESRNSWDLKNGEIMITNKRVIAIKPKGMFSGAAEGYEISLLGFNQFEPRETRGAFTGGSMSEIILRGSQRTLTLDMSFVSQKAQAMAALNMFNAAMGGSSQKSRSWLDYTKKTRTENSSQQFINSLAAQSHTIKEAFYQLMSFVVKYG
jgi:hypothetical protein